MADFSWLTDAVGNAAETAGDFLGFDGNFGMQNNSNATYSLGGLADSFGNAWNGNLNKNYGTNSPENSFGGVSGSNRSFSNGVSGSIPSFNLGGSNVGGTDWLSALKVGGDLYNQYETRKAAEDAADMDNYWANKNFNMYQSQLDRSNKKEDTAQLAFDTAGSSFAENMKKLGLAGTSANDTTSMVS
jgi:hypothetical protein